MIDVLIKRVCVYINFMKYTRIEEKSCNCLYFKIDQEMDAISLIVYGVC